jgi:hypothetical protein
MSCLRMTRSSNPLMTSQLRHLNDGTGTCACTAAPVFVIREKAVGIFTLEELDR